MHSVKLNNAVLCEFEATDNVRSVLVRVLVPIQALTNYDCGFIRKVLRSILDRVRRGPSAMTDNVNRICI